MRKTTDIVEPYRVTKFSSLMDGHNGLFVIPELGDDGSPLKVIASTGIGWDHVSVVHPDREPSNREMSQIKDLFFDFDENVIEFHDYPPVEWGLRAEITREARHMWSPQDRDVPRPPDVISSVFLLSKDLPVEDYEKIEGSSNIAAVKYDAGEQTLKVVFTSSGHYQYSGVPQDVHDGLLEADSVGKYFHANIRDKYPALKIEENPSA